MSVVPNSLLLKRGSGRWNSIKKTGAYGAGLFCYSVLFSENDLSNMRYFEFQRFAQGKDKSGTKFVIVATLVDLLN